MIKRFIRSIVLLPVNHLTIHIILFLTTLLFRLANPLACNAQDTVTGGGAASRVVAGEAGTDADSLTREAGVTSISYNHFNQGLITSPEGLIAGRLPGLLIRTADGSPSPEYSIATLHNTTFYSLLSPLMIVDGVPVTGAPLLLNPHDVESITWLQEGQAAEYGSLARNGALLINTRKGDTGIHLTYTGGLALSSVKKYRVLTGDQVRYALSEYFADEPGAAGLAGTANTDWQEEIYRLAVSHDHHLGLSGNLGPVPVRLSAGQTLEQGTIRSSSWSRTSFTGRADPGFFNDDLKVSLSVAGYYSNMRTPGSYLPYYAAIADPTMSVYVNDDPALGYSSGPSVINPVAILNLNESGRRPGQLSVNLSAGYMPCMIPGLKIGLVAAASDYSEKGSEVVGPGGIYPITNGLITSTESSIISRVLDLNAGYTLALESLKGNLELKAGYLLTHLGNKTNELTADYVNPQIIYENRHLYLENNRSSAFIKTGLTVLGRYKFTAIVREDSFSEFARDNRKFFSPAAMAEWIISKEPFFPAGGMVDELAVNFSWGLAGSGIVTGSSGLQIDPQLRPESMQYIITGMRLSLLGSRLHLSLNGFSNANRDMLIEAVIPSSSFSSTMLINGGSADNRGIEMSAGAEILRGKDFRWNTSFHFTLRENNIRSLGSGISSLRSGPVPLIPYAYVLTQETGRSPNSFYLLKQVYDENGMPVQGLYEDYNENGVYDFDDRYVGHSADPEFSAGIWSSFSYRNWEFTFSASALSGNWNYNIESVFGNYGSLISNNALRNIPVLVYESGLTGMTAYSDYHVEDGSFIRIDFVSLQHIFRDINGKNTDIRISGTLQNALILTAYRGSDPDIGGGISGFPWPRPVIGTLTLGVEF
jgi:iron complex outermembrane receptor protein